MADYYPLLARALDAMPERSTALRQAIYARARGALLGQLRSLDPPLSEADIDLERNALEAAILRLEQDYGTPAPPAPTVPEPAPTPEPFIPGSANDVDPPEPARPEVPEPERSEAPPFAPAPVARDAGPLASPNLGRDTNPPKDTNPPEDTSLPKATLPPSPPEPTVPVEPVQAGPPPAPPVLSEAVQAGAVPSAPVIPVEPMARVVEPAVRIQARKGKAPPFVAPPEAEATAPAGESPDLAAEPSVLDANGQRQRPRIDVVAPREGRTRLLRNLFVGGILVVVIGLIAVAAFLLRDKPADLQPIATETRDSAQDGGESKFADRVSGEAAPVERPTQGRRPTAPAVIPTPNAANLAIAQRAVLYEENSAGGANAAPNATQGRVVWRLDTVPGEQGQPLETVVRAKVDFTDAGISLAMTLRRNLDATLPASHTIELVFTPSGPEAAQHGVQDIGLLQGKDEEGARGSPVAGLPVRVRENLFLIGLSSLPNDIERNTDILLQKNWFDVTLKFTSSRRGIVAFEKGGAGAQVLQAAFDQWR